MCRSKAKVSWVLVQAWLADGCSAESGGVFFGVPVVAAGLYAFAVEVSVCCDGLGLVQTPRGKFPRDCVAVLLRFRALSIGFLPAPPDLVPVRL